MMGFVCEISADRNLWLELFYYKPALVLMRSYVQDITRRKMSPTSIGGRYSLGLQASSISPASLKLC